VQQPQHKAVLASALSLLVVVIFRANLGVTTAMVGLHRIGAKNHLAIAETVRVLGAG